MRGYGPLAIRYVRRRRRWAWRGLTLDVPNGVFHPGLFFSTSVLAAGIEGRARRGLTVLDVGCGSGLLAMAAARAGATVTAIDINASAVEATRANAAANRLAVEVLRSDLFAAVDGRSFELVVVNPPFFAKDPVDDAERAWFAGGDLGYFDRFFAGLGAHLTPGGTTLMVLSEGCDLNTIAGAAADHGFLLVERQRTQRWFGQQVVYEIARSSH
jgi:release factor glutamine methyltransferase